MTCAESLAIYIDHREKRVEQKQRQRNLSSNRLSNQHIGITRRDLQDFMQALIIYLFISIITERKVYPETVLFLEISESKACLVMNSQRSHSTDPISEKHSGMRRPVPGKTRNSVFLQSSCLSCMLILPF